MTIKTLALLFFSALTSLLLSTLTYVMPNPSDAYRVGYAEGRFDLYTESRATRLFYECIAEKRKEWEAEKNEKSQVEEKKAAEACWQKQIDWTKAVYRAWDGMTDHQKIDHVAPSAQSKDGIKWAEILRGNGDSKVMPPLPVEIK